MECQTCGWAMRNFRATGALSACIDGETYSGCGPQNNFANWLTLEEVVEIQRIQKKDW